MGYWLEVLQKSIISAIFVWGSDYLLLVCGGILRQYYSRGAVTRQLLEPMFSDMHVLEPKKRSEFNISKFFITKFYFNY